MPRSDSSHAFRSIRHQSWVIGLVVATGFNVESDSSERPGRRYQVNRPVEGVPGRPATEDTGTEVARSVYGAAYAGDMGSWLLTKARAWLTHLHVLGEVSSNDETPETWSLD